MENFEQLPLEIRTFIISFVSVKERNEKLKLVSKSFYEYVSILSKPATLNIHQPFFNDPTIYSSMMASKMRVNELYIGLKRREGLDARKINDIFEKFGPRVKKVSFNQCANDTILLYPNVYELLAHTPNVEEVNFILPPTESLHMSDSHKDDIQKLTKLRKVFCNDGGKLVDLLRMLPQNTLRSYRGQLWPQVDEVLTHHSESLTELVMDGQTFEGDTCERGGILIKLLPKLRNLRTVSLDGMICDSKLLKAVCKISNLEEFTLGACHSVYHDIYKLGDIKSLKKLKISGDEHEEMLSEYSLPVMNNIEEFACTLMLSSDDLTTLAHCFPNLKHLKVFSELETLENDFYFDILPNLQKLTKIQGRFKTCTSERKTYPKVTEMKFNYGSITSDAVTAFPNLQVLHVACEFEKEVFERLSSLKYLKELNVVLFDKNLSNWTDKDRDIVEVINQLCRKINKVEIRLENTTNTLMREALREGCENFNDDSFFMNTEAFMCL